MPSSWRSYNDAISKVSALISYNSVATGVPSTLISEVSTLPLHIKKYICRQKSSFYKNGAVLYTVHQTTYIFRCKDQQIYCIPCTIHAAPSCCTISSINLVETSYETYARTPQKGITPYFLSLGHDLTAFSSH